MVDGVDGVAGRLGGWAHGWPANERLAPLPNPARRGPQQASSHTDTHSPPCRTAARAPCAAPRPSRPAGWTRARPACGARLPPSRRTLAATPAFSERSRGRQGGSCGAERRRQRLAWQGSSVQRSLHSSPHRPAHTQRACRMPRSWGRLGMARNADAMDTVLATSCASSRERAEAGMSGREGSGARTMAQQAASAGRVPPSLPAPPGARLHGKVAQPAEHEARAAAKVGKRVADDAGHEEEDGCAAQADLRCAGA